MKQRWTKLSGSGDCPSIPSDDFIIFNGKPRKVVTGNNGNFDPNVKNNFGGLIPYIVSAGTTIASGMLNNE